MKHLNFDDIKIENIPFERDSLEYTLLKGIAYEDVIISDIDDNGNVKLSFDQNFYDDYFFEYTDEEIGKAAVKIFEFIVYDVLGVNKQE